MVLNKYLKRIADLLDDNKRRCNEEKQCLHTVLAKLKNREEILNARLSGHPPEHVRKAMEREQKVVCAQLSKGIERLAKLERNDRGSRYVTPHFAG